jgi:hypothetical protein
MQFSSTSYYFIRRRFVSDHELKEAVRMWLSDRLTIF